MPVPFHHPAPAPPGLFEKKQLPYATANPISAFLFQWVTPIIKVGYSRPIHAEDLWQLTDELKCKEGADKLLENFLARFPPSRRVGPFPLKNDQPDPEAVKHRGKSKTDKNYKGRLAYEEGKTYDMSLFKAIFVTVRKQFVIAAMYSAAAQGLHVTAPLLTKRLIDDMVKAHDYHQAVKAGACTETLPRAGSVGNGIGIAFGLFVMMISSGILAGRAMYDAQAMGAVIRAAVGDSVSRKSMRLSGKARHTITNGRINTIMAYDAGFIEWLFQAVISLPATPFVVIIGIALLVNLLGYSALVGVGILVLLGPLQGYLFKLLVRFRREQVARVDERVRVLSEITNSVRSVKLFAWEDHFANMVLKMRVGEHGILRNDALCKSTVHSVFVFMPIVAITVTFITYGLTGHDLKPGTISAGLQLFNVIRIPLQELGQQITAVIDCHAAIGRVSEVLTADEVPERLVIGDTVFSVEMTGDFQYDEVSGKITDEATNGRKTEGINGNAPTVANEENPAIPFALRNVDMKIPQGALVCIVGRVGTGKSSLLLGLLNEIGQTKGHIRLGGTVSYVPQQAWVQSGTIRENILFGSDHSQADLARVEQVIEACGLGPDVSQWQDGDLTRIGEKGITLSGGQKQRICIARAAYEDTQIVLLDDPLSAVDAHVGQHLLENCILAGPFAHRTRILVTHSLDVLPRADLIVVVDRDDSSEGRVVQQGTYSELVSTAGTFQTLINEFGSISRGKAAAGYDTDVPGKSATSSSFGTDQPAVEQVKGGTRILEEERVTGAVSWKTYKDYFGAIRSPWVIVAFLVLQVLEQVSLVGSSLFLGFWSGNTLGLSTNLYIAIYASFGAAMAVFSWAGPCMMLLAGLRAAFHLFDGAWLRVMRSPTGWHDCIPTGRIISRFSKDVACLDDRLMKVCNEFLAQVLTMLGTFALITYTFPWLALMFFPMIGYIVVVAGYYRLTSREAKRIDSLLRSHVYSCLAEQLAGLAVIRAFGRQATFARRLQIAIDDNNRAVFITLALVRWVVLRLSLLIQSLILLVAIFGVIFRETVNPARFGVVLVYALSTAISIQQLVTLFVQVEQDMIAVERVQYYNELEVEAAPLLTTDPKPEEWPTQGSVEFEEVALKYRPDLPPVLKGVSFSIKPGEKVGIIGRTGAGKSSIAQALFRTVEICGGTVRVDGLDLKSLGLTTLRSRLSIIPQEAFLFTGSVRENLDPMGIKTDAQLNDALNLIHLDPSASHSLREKFKLDASVSADGDNFSAGEKQLLCLLRALVRNCKVLLLDEATSSVDPETDALIQRIIQTEFANVTLISIAHRLQTVAYYDRILVIDAGQVAEYDTPLGLFDSRGSKFRSLCDKKDIHREDLLRIQADAATTRKKPD